MKWLINKKHYLLYIYILVFTNAVLSCMSIAAIVGYSQYKSDYKELEIASRDLSTHTGTVLKSSQVLADQNNELLEFLGICQDISADISMITKYRPGGPYSSENYTEEIGVGGTNELE